MRINVNCVEDMDHISHGGQPILRTWIVHRNPYDSAQSQFKVSHADHRSALNDRFQKLRSRSPAMGE
jgi:hypothetical protein